jgi:hypothetical protein
MVSITAKIAKTTSREVETVFPRAKTGDEEREAYQMNALSQLLF